MARILEAKHAWTFAQSTGAGKAIKLSPSVANISVYFTTSSGCTATVQLETAAESSEGPYASLGSASALSTGSAVLHQFSGPMEWVRPRVASMSTASTNAVRAFLIAN